MGTSRDYLPQTDNDFRAWAQNLQTRLVAEGGVGGDAWGVSAQQISDYTAAYQAYDAAWIAANQTDTRTKTTITTKNDTRDALRELSRYYVQNILQVNPAMTDTIRTQLQITIRDADPTNIDPPATAPIVNIAKVFGSQITVDLRDSLNSESRAKPDGVAGATILYFVGDNAPTGGEQWIVAGLATRTAHTVTLPSTIAAGTKVWMSAQWFNPKTETGPAATPVSTNIGFEGSQAQAA